MTDMNFEKALEKLEKIVDEMESGKLPLDDSLKRYEEGIKLIQLCSKRLETAQKKVELLTKTSAGKFQLKPFEEKSET